MKKYHLILSAGLMVLLFMMFCRNAYAETLTAVTKDKVEEMANGRGVDVETVMGDLLNSMEDAHPGKTQLSISNDFAIDGNTRNININKLKTTATVDGEQRIKELPLKDSYITPMFDVILIRDRSGRPLDTGTSLNRGNCDIYNGGNALTEGSILMIVGDDGVIRSFYAGAVNDNSLQLGDKVNIYRCIACSHYQTDTDNELTPTWTLPAIALSKTDPFLSDTITASSGLGAFKLHIDITTGIYWKDYWGYPELLVNNLSGEIDYPDVVLDVDVDSGRELSADLTLLTVGVDVDGLASFSSSVVLGVSGEGNGTSTFDANITEGFHMACYYDGLIEIENAGWIGGEPTFTVQSSDMDGEVYFRLAQEYEAGLLCDAIAIVGELPAGFVNEGEVCRDHEFPDDDEKKYWHECETGECACGKCFARLGPAGIYWKFLGGSNHTIIESPSKDSDPFLYFYSSKTFGDSGNSDSAPPCPHKGYRLNTKVVNQDGKLLPLAKVSYSPAPAAHYEGACSGTTGTNGKAVLYAPTGDIAVSVSLTSKVDPSIVITGEQMIKKTADVQDVTITLDIPSKHIYFQNSAAGEPKDWPDDVTFVPFYSEDVILPFAVPELSGLQFIGWNTRADGSGKNYSPGTRLTASDDVTLWAQWRIAGNDWYVIYNANGGTYAPMPQSYARRQDAEVTSELPESGKMIFKGWTPDLHTLDHIYHGGDRLPYDSEKNFVVLYAMWDLSPVSKPIHISFDSNGAQGAKPPADVWMERDSWLQLNRAIAPLGSDYNFLGWSEDPDSRDPEFLAGNSYYFYKDVVLYAIWNQSPDPKPDPKHHDSDDDGEEPVKAAVYNPDALIVVFLVNDIKLESAKFGKQIQGPMGQAAFSSGRPAGWTEAFTFNMTVNDKADYTAKNGYMIMTIPHEYQKEGRTFAIMGLDQNGAPHIFNDTDAIPSTVTAKVDLAGYAFALIYKD